MPARAALAAHLSGRGATFAPTINASCAYANDTVDDAHLWLSKMKYAIYDWYAVLGRCILGGRVMARLFFSVSVFGARPLFKLAQRRASLACIATSLATSMAASANAQVLPPNPDPTCTTTSSEFSSWFQTRPGLDQPVKAANSIMLNTSKNCNFYKWSEQMFLWLTSPATGVYRGNRVLDSQIFYQVGDNGDLIPQGPNVPAPKLMLRAAKSGPNGLPVVISSKGHLREFVTAPSRSGLVESRVLGGGAGEISTVAAGSNGKAVFKDAEGKTVAFTPKVTVGMLPKTLTRLDHLASSTGDGAALSAVDARQKIADALTALHVLIAVNGKDGTVFVEAGTGAIVTLGPGQAGGNGVLLSQQRAVIYYEALANDVYAWYLTGRKTPNGIPPYYDKKNASTFGLFPTTNANLQSIINFSTAHGGPRTFPDQQALAVEIKLSWVDASTLPSGAQGYITSRADVPVYNTSNPTDWVPTGFRPTTVALIGAHIVGSANGHPEMIWATFEHQANTPLATYTYNSGGKTLTVASNTSGMWLLSASGASGPFNSKLATLCPNGKKECASSQAGHIVATSSAAIGPSNILRQKAWGVASNGTPNQEDATPAASNTEILSFDTDVRSKLGAAGAAADPRAAYLLIGATWTLGGGEPTCPYPRPPNTPPLCRYAAVDEIGTSMLANSTMETFMQGSTTTFESGTNCFSCHQSSGHDPKTKANTEVSHLFGFANRLSFPTQQGK